MVISDNINYVLFYLWSSPDIGSMNQLYGLKSL